MWEIARKTTTAHWGQVLKINVKFLLERWDHFTMLNFIFFYLNWIDFEGAFWLAFTLLLRSSDARLLVGVGVRTM